MAEPEQRATLRDVINYEPEQYLSDEEIKLIQATFRGNNQLFKILRKVMAPTISDPELPIEQMGNDFYFSAREWAQIPAEEAKILIAARQDALQFIFGGLIKLKVIANQEIKSPLSEEVRRSKDSNQ